MKDKLKKILIFCVPSILYGFMVFSFYLNNITLPTHVLATVTVLSIFLGFVLLKVSALPNIKDKEIPKELSFLDWVAETIDSSKEYPKEYIEKILETDLTHDGDCTDKCYACHLCVLETLLTEYREYCFK